MTQQGFEEYLYSIFGKKTGAAKSYIKAIQIIDEMFIYNDVFNLKGKSIVNISDYNLLAQIKEYIHYQQSLFRNSKESIFSNISINQHSYPKNGFCSAALKHLLDYHVYYYKQNT